jgi:hypothetical protein
LQVVQQEGGEQDATQQPGRTTADQQGGGTTMMQEGDATNEEAEHVGLSAIIEDPQRYYGQTTTVSGAVGR